MIDIRKNATFVKHFNKRIAFSPSLKKQFNERLNLFLTNPQNPLLHDHPLKGTRKGNRAFSMSGDIRIIYIRISDNEIALLDIGSHNQVYK